MKVMEVWDLLHRVARSGRGECTWGKERKDQVNLNIFLCDPQVFELLANFSNNFKQLIDKKGFCS